MSVPSLASSLRPAFGFALPVALAPAVRSATASAPASAASLKRSAWKGKAYVVFHLEYWECPDCGEHVYDHAAMRKIEACSPAYAKRQKNKRAAAG